MKTRHSNTVSPVVATANNSFPMSSTDVSKSEQIEEFQSTISSSIPNLEEEIQSVLSLDQHPIETSNSETIQIKIEPQLPLTELPDANIHIKHEVLTQVTSSIHDDDEVEIVKPTNLKRKTIIDVDDDPNTDDEEGKCLHIQFYKP